ncbi:MAG: dihydropteroate synthase [Candidatus Lokiarchaeota archaeon]|nr:dihydropteroate synthase [Candidatus Lokiarchaeota archaeon]
MMTKIKAKFFDVLEIGDDYPTVLMGVLNLSPESFYRDSVYQNSEQIRKGISQMIENGAKMLDLGARSTAPWSKKISIEEEVQRIVPAMELVCKTIPRNIIISIDTQYEIVAKKAYQIASKHGKLMLINDVSCLQTDPLLEKFIIEHHLPAILMASKNLPGDILTVEEMVKLFTETINRLKNKGYDENFLILDPGIGKWIEQKTHDYDLKIIGNLKKLRSLNKPILVAISRKSFIGTTLNLPQPEDRLNGTLSATAIAVYNGAHIVRTHDVNVELQEMIKMAEEIRRNA